MIKVSPWINFSFWFISVLLILLLSYLQLCSWIIVSQFLCIISSWLCIQGCILRPFETLALYPLLADFTCFSYNRRCLLHLPCYCMWECFTHLVHGDAVPTQLCKWYSWIHTVRVMRSWPSSWRDTPRLCPEVIDNEASRLKNSNNKLSSHTQFYQPFTH